MYIYQVTHIPSRKFYIGIEDMPLHQSNMVIDPYNMFEELTMGHNGSVPINNLVKEVIMRVATKSEANDEFAKLAKHYENNALFLGVPFTKKPFNLKEFPPKPTKIDPPIKSEDMKPAESFEKNKK